MRVWSLALLALVLLAACGTAPGAPDVEGRTFTGETTEGFDLVPGSEITVTFTDGQVSASAGCNTMFGAAEWSGDTLEVENLAMTAMGCDEERHQQDETVAQLLTGGPTVTVQGTTLTIAGNDLRIVLEEVPDAVLEGTTWLLEGLVEGESVSTLPQGISPSLVISNGEAKIDFGCNGGGGQVEVTDSTLEFKKIITTLKGCEGEIMRVEHHMQGVLEGTVDYEIDGNRLSITSGEQGLTFRSDQG